MTKKTELLNEVSNQGNNKKMVMDDIRRYVEIVNSPFTAIKNGEEWRIVIGNEIASKEVFDTLEDVEDYIESKPWELILIGSDIFSRMIVKNETKEEKS